MRLSLDDEARREVSRTADVEDVGLAFRRLCLGGILERQGNAVGVAANAPSISRANSSRAVFDGPIASSPRKPLTTGGVSWAGNSSRRTALSGSSQAILELDRNEVVTAELTRAPGGQEGFHRGEIPIAAERLVDRGQYGAASRACARTNGSRIRTPAAISTAEHNTTRVTSLPLASESPH